MMMKMLNNDRQQAMVLMRGLNRAAGSRGVRAGIRAIGRLVRARHRCGEEGGALVEFALVFPLMLVLMTGMFSVVMAVMNYQQLGNATNGAAQQLITARGNVADPCAVVVTAVTGTLPSWTTSKFTYTVTLTNSAGTATTYGPTAGSGFSCTAGAAVLTSGTGAEGQPASVTVTYQYTWLPIMWSGWAPVLNLSGNLRASAAVLVD
jgi:Flp pilus assembly protein TadG